MRRKTFVKLWKPEKYYDAHYKIDWRELSDEYFVRVASENDTNYGGDGMIALNNEAQKRIMRKRTYNTSRWKDQWWSRFTNTFDAKYKSNGVYVHQMQPVLTIRLGIHRYRSDIKSLEYYKKIRR